MLDKIKEIIASVVAAIDAGNSWLNNLVWGWPMIVLILGTGLLLTIRMKGLQITKFGTSLKETIIPTIKSIGRKKTEDKRANSISQFEAFSAAISGTIGTGNILGVASAILTGGPGAVFWMWISAFFGMLTNYTENVLGLYYRKKEKNGDLSGGAMYYISEGLKCKWLGCLAAIFCAVAAIGMSGAQTNKISGTFQSLDLPIDDTLMAIIVGVVVAVIVALVIIGGIKRIGKVASILVPFMSLIFIIMSLVIIAMHIDRVGTAFGLIFSNIFSYEAAFGGAAGFAFSQIIKKGLARGVFSNEAGLGSSVIAHSASETREPVKQGLWGIFEVFLDTFVVCTLTALIILTTYEEPELLGGVDAAISMGAFTKNFGVVGTVVFSTILPLFAFTTIIAWSYYGEKAIDFLFRKRSDKTRKNAVLVFKILYVILIVCAALIENELAWEISDTSNALMAIPNLVAVIFLSGQVIKITKNYFQRKKGEDVEPMLSAYPELNEEFKKDIEDGIG